MLNQKGFTLIEIIAVMIILGVLVVVAVPRLISVDNRAEEIAFDLGVEELNGREKLLWHQLKLGSISFSNEELNDKLWLKMLNNLDIGHKYILSSVSSSGGTLKYGSQVVVLERAPATSVYPASWGGTDSHGNKYGWHKNPSHPHYTE